MSGGRAYVWDRDGTFADRCNPDMVDLDPVYPSTDDADRLCRLVTAHRDATASPLAQSVLDRWPDVLGAFVTVFPKAFKEALQADRAEAAVAA
jgi:glutamate synthase (NADPH/NADH) large chain